MNGIWPVNMNWIMHWLLNDHWIRPLSKITKNELSIRKGNYSKLLFNMYWVWTINRYGVRTIDWHMLHYWDFLHNGVWLGNMNCEIDKKSSSELLFCVQTVWNKFTWNMNWVWYPFLNWIGSCLKRIYNIFGLYNKWSTENIRSLKRFYEIKFYFRNSPGTGTLTGYGTCFSTGYGYKTQVIILRKFKQHIRCS